jgi:hypothetical protein
MPEFDATTHKELFEQISKEWDQAEVDIKASENVVGRVVFPAIKELRYAGRQFLYALDKAARGGSHQDVEFFLREAKYNCHRARHDAIDAATAKITFVLEDNINRLVADVVVALFPRFFELRKVLRSIRAEVAGSRGSSHSRELSYKFIEENQFLLILDCFEEFLANEDLILKEVARRKLREEDLDAQKKIANRSYWVGVVSLAAGLIAFAFSIVVYIAT